MSKYFYLLDPGHGGLIDNVYQTQGKRSPIWEDGTIYYEGVGNRKIAKKVGDQLKKLGIDFAYTVDPSNGKDVSLTTRINFVNRFPAKNKVLVSIHSNGFDDPKAHGWQCHVYLNPVTNTSSSKSLMLAEVFIEQFQTEFPNIKLRGKEGLVQNNLAMTRETNCPALLLENFFHTNEKECKEILMTEEGQNKIVKSILQAICKLEQ